jgi:hypothetical protein
MNREVEMKDRRIDVDKWFGLGGWQSARFDPVVGREVIKTLPAPH